MTDYNNYVLNMREKITFLIMVSALCIGTGYLFYETFISALIIPLIYKRCKRIYIDTLVKKRRSRLLVEFKDFLYLISSSLATGRHIISAMDEAKEGLERIHQDSLMSDEIRWMVRRVNEAGETDENVIADLALRSGLEDIEDFAQVFKCCRQTGGNLIEAVNKASNIIGEKIIIEREIYNVASQKKMEGRIITAMPVVIIVFLQILSPEYLNIMYETLTGRVLMTAALGATIGAYIAIERITSIDI